MSGHQKLSDCTWVANAWMDEIEARVRVNIDDTTSKILARLGKIGVSDEEDALIGSEETKMSGKDDVRSRDATSFAPFQQFPGFLKIASGQVAPFWLSGDDGRVFVTIKTSGMLLAHNYPIPNDRNVIVDLTGHVRLAEGDKIWINESGEDVGAEWRRQHGCQ